MENKLVLIKENLKLKATANENEELVYAMFADVAAECLLQLERMNQLKVNTSSGQIIIEEIMDSLESFIEMPYKLLISKKCYESFDELIADFEDWIENTNEFIEDNEKILPYMESWNIGLFFE